jgi:hypothetical protein
MSDDDVTTLLVELHDRIHAPAVPAGDDVRRGERLLRRRRTITVATLAAAAAAVVLTVGLARSAPAGDGNDLQPAPAPSDPTETAPNQDAVFEAELREIVERVPDWSIEDTQPMFNSGPCAGDWASASTGGGGGNFDVSTNGETGQVWHQKTGFRSAAEASGAVVRFVENLSSCATVAWQTEPIGRTGAVLAFSADGVIWVHQDGRAVAVLEAATTDGPPPPDVQVQVADLLSSDLE